MPSGSPAAGEPVAAAFAEAGLRSFSDPDGHIEFAANEVVRYVARSRWDGLVAFLATPVALKWQESGRLIAARKTGASSDGRAMTLSHPRVWFATYPYEWIPLQLADAARLTLELQFELLTAGYELKDASPYNVLFDGSKALFVDILSPQPCDRRPAWLAYGQFLRCFVHPLLVARYWRLPLSSFFLREKNPDWGAWLVRAMPWTLRYSPLGLVALTIPYRLAKRRVVEPASATPAKPGNTTESETSETDPRALEAKRLASRLLRWALGRAAGRLTHKRSTVWGTYRTHHLQHYSDESQRLREASLERWCAAERFAKVLDIGCNDGLFSFIAARHGAKVIGVDGDEESLTVAYRRATEESLDFSPMHMDLARPSPRAGWANREFPSFLDRAEGQFDLVIMMAVMHHLVVSSRIPLEEVIKFAAQCSRHALAFEFVPETDPRFKELAGVNQPLYRDINAEEFETMFERYFTIMERVALPGGRTIYFGVRR